MEYEYATKKKVLSSVKNALEIELIKKAIDKSEKHLNEKQYSNALNTAYILSPLIIRGNVISAALLYETKISEETIKKERRAITSLCFI